MCMMALCAGLAISICNRRIKLKLQAVFHTIPHYKVSCDNFIR